MFFDKLLVRIRGELIALREDLAAEEGLRGQAELLLRRLEDKLGVAEEKGLSERSDDPSAEQVRQRDLSGAHVPADLRQEWEDLMKRRVEKNVDRDEDPPPPVNPRELG